MPPKATFSLAAIRKAAERRAGETSLRATAEEIGMSYTGFRAFLKGGKPHPETLGHLVAWHSRSRTEISRTEVDAAVALLVEYVRSGASDRSRATRLKGIQENLQKGVAG